MIEFSTRVREILSPDYMLCILRAIPEKMPLSGSSGISPGLLCNLIFFHLAFPPALAQLQHQAPAPAAVPQYAEHALTSNICPFLSSA